MYLHYFYLGKYIGYVCVYINAKYEQLHELDNVPFHPGSDLPVAINSCHFGCTAGLPLASGR